MAKIESDQIHTLISDNIDAAAELAALYDAYKAEVLPVHNRAAARDRSICNKIENDWRGLIVDQCVGYLFGEPIVYDLNRDKYRSDVEYQKIITLISEFNTNNSIDDLDAETGELAAVCGAADRLLYINKGGDIGVVSINPWEVIYIRDKYGNTTSAMRYYESLTDTGESLCKVEVYDDKNVTFYVQNAPNSELYILDPDIVGKNPRPHNFIAVPLIRFKNNKNEQGDFEKVEKLIDSYDNIVSNNQDELDEFREAYLKLTGGVRIDPGEANKMRQTGTMEVPEGADVEWLIKEVNCEFNKHQLSTLSANIYRFSKTVDMGDENFSGSGQTGESRKWKLIGLENKAVKKERKFTAALREQYRLICAVWKTKSINIDHKDIKFEFTRNLPVELITSADVASKLDGIVSQKTLVTQMPFITDPEAEMKQINYERAEGIDLDKVNSNSDDDG